MEKDISSAQTRKHRDQLRPVSDKSLVVKPWYVSYQCVSPFFWILSFWHSASLNNSRMLIIASFKPWLVHMKWWCVSQRFLNPFPASCGGVGTWPPRGRGWMNHLRLISQLLTFKLAPENGMPSFQNPIYYYSILTDTQAQQKCMDDRAVNDWLDYSLVPGLFWQGTLLGFSMQNPL